MEAVIVFIPNNLQYQPPGFLIGCFREYNNICRSIFVFGTKRSAELNEKNGIIGCYNPKDDKSLHNERKKYSFWISISYYNEDVFVSHCIVNSKVQKLKDCLLIVYDHYRLLKSELLVASDKEEENEIDHFKLLASELKSHNACTVGYTFRELQRIFDVILFLLCMVNFVISKFYFVTKYSALATHFTSYFHNFKWAKNTHKTTRYINLKIGNFLMSVITDIFLGLLLYYFITSWKTSSEIFGSISSCTEIVISSIRDIVKWLMGSPAGLKLNQPLSSILGSLVFYYLDIWWSFLSLMQPILEIFFQIFIKIGFFGLSFQIAVCSDIFAIISFHVYCIYVYAARLYEIQAKGIYSLSRLFFGGKRNPEPGKVDSCPYSTEELLIGTISFAVLLFLLPTTLVYYIVFTVMRLGVILISGFLNKSIYFMEALPVYATFLWLFFPAYTSTTIKLTPCERSKKNKGCLIAEPASSSWIETIKSCKPDLVYLPISIKFGETVWKIITGKLI